MAKVKCIAKHMVGASTSSSKGSCHFDSEGFAEVSDELATHLAACKVVTLVADPPKTTVVDPKAVTKK
jgi:hypothetical protein